MRRGQDELVTRQAVAVGKTVAAQVASARARYSKEIVAQLKPKGVAFSAQPGVGEAPLPATFLTHISEQLKSSGGEDGVSFVLRSGWDINSKQGITSDFEQQGWANLLKQEQQARGSESATYEPYWEKLVLADGTEVIQVMTVDLASA
jgi:hypothetical protein